MILNSAIFNWKRNNGLPEKSFLDYVLYMAICFTCLSAYVPYVPTCFCILRVYIPMFFVFYVPTCVGLCVFILFHREGFFRLQDVWDILQGYGSTMLCCHYHSRCFCQIPSSPFPNMSYFTSKDKTPARWQMERKRYDIWFREKMIYIDIGCKSATEQTNKWRKDTKDKEATLI